MRMGRTITPRCTGRWVPTSRRGNVKLPAYTQPPKSAGKCLPQPRIRGQRRAIGSTNCMSRCFGAVLEGMAPVRQASVLQGDEQTFSPTEEEESHQEASPWDLLLGEKASEPFREEDEFVTFRCSPVESRRHDHLIREILLGPPSLKTAVWGDSPWLGSSQGE